MKSERRRFRSLRKIGVAVERSFFIENLSVLIAAGLPVIEAIRSIQEDMRSRKFKRICSEMIEALDSGSTLWKAMEDTSVFTDYTLSLVRIGEESGRLAENLRVIYRQQDKDRKLISKVQSAMMYPVFVLVLTFVIGVGIAWFILPKLAQVFSQLELELPFLTKVLIGFGEFLGDHGEIFVPSFVGAVLLLLLIVFVIPKTRFIGQFLLFHTPGIGRLIQEASLARMGYLLGTLLEAGIPVVDALNSLIKASRFPSYTKFYIFLRDQIQIGESFNSSFEQYQHVKKVLPSSVSTLVVTGERTGTLGESFVRIGDNYEQKAVMTTKNLTTLLEPILLVIVWLGVVGVALAVILPIYNLVGGLNISG